MGFGAEGIMRLRQALIEGTRVAVTLVVGASHPPDRLQWSVDPSLDRPELTGSVAPLSCWLLPASS